MNTTGVAVEISADSSAFLRGMEQTKAIARAAAANIQASMAQIKGPPVPDLGKIIGINKQQVFKLNSEILTNTKASSAKLTALLEKNAASYRADAENQIRHLRSVQVEANRIRLSGTVMPALPSAAGRWDHLQGTQFAGGTRGKGGKPSGFQGGGAYAAGVAYNFGQDLTQGGIAAVANNVPQIIQLVMGSPAIKGVLAAGGAAAAAIISSALALWSYKKNVYDVSGAGFDKIVGKNYDAGHAEAARKKLASARKTASETSTKQAGIDADNQGNRGGRTDRSIDTMRRSAEETADAREAGWKLKRDALEDMADPAAKVRAIAELEKAQLREKLELQGAVAARALEMALAEERSAEARAKSLRDESAALTKSALTPADLDKRKALEIERPAVMGRLEDARDRSGSASRDLSAVEARAALLPLENKLIDQNRDRQLKKISEDAMKDSADAAKKRAADEAEGLAAQAKAAEKFKEMWAEAAEKAEAAKNEFRAKAAAQKKAMGELQEQLEIGEAQAGGSGRKAKRLERKKSLRENTEKYKAAGFSDGDAAAMARREQRVGDRRDHPGRIHGAGSHPAAERQSGLDYFHKTPMSKPQTGKLDEYERRRTIPGVGGTADKGMAEREAEAAKKTGTVKSEGDSQTHALLKELLQAVKSSFSGNNTSVSPVPDEARPRGR